MSDVTMDGSVGKPSRSQIVEAVHRVQAPPEQSRRVDACGNCRFMSPDTSDGGVGLFECRRRSPRRHGFPRTSPTDWCGDYELVGRAPRKLETI